MNCFTFYWFNLKPYLTLGASGVERLTLLHEGADLGEIEASLAEVEPDQEAVSVVHGRRLLGVPREVPELLNKEQFRHFSKLYPILCHNLIIIQFYQLRQ